VIDAAALRYALVGVANTALGFGCILVLQEFLEVQPYLANGVGFAMGLCMSYFLNRRFAFRSSRAHTVAAPAFLLAAAVSFAVNMAVLRLGLTILGLPDSWAQGLAVVSYAVCFYLLNRYVVFARAGC
jgi:putative flippase GtrA